MALYFPFREIRITCHDDICSQRKSTAFESIIRYADTLLFVFTYNIYGKQSA